MRKLAPFVFTTIATLVAGTAAAATNETTSAATPTEQMSGSPTVPANTASPQGLSYSDKSNTSPGTNAKMNDKNAMSTIDPAVEKRNEKARKKAKVAKANDMGMTHNMPMNTMPADTTGGAAANSTTGVSGGK